MKLWLRYSVLIDVYCIVHSHAEGLFLLGFEGTWGAFQILDVPNLSLHELRMKSACKSSALREPTFATYHDCRAKILQVEI